MKKLALLWMLVILPSAALAQDGTWTFGAIGALDYRLDAVSSTDLFAGALPASDPTLNLTIGKRYQATVAASPSSKERRGRQPAARSRPASSA